MCRVSTFWYFIHRWHCSLFLFMSKEAVFLVVIEFFFLGIKKINVTFTGLRNILKVKEIIFPPIKGCLNSRYGRGWRGVILVFSYIFKFHDQKCVKNPQSSKFLLGGCRRFLTGVLEDGVLLDIIYHLDRPQ